MGLTALESRSSGDARAQARAQQNRDSKRKQVRTSFKPGNKPRTSSCSQLNPVNCLGSIPALEPPSIHLSHPIPAPLGFIWPGTAGTALNPKGTAAAQGSVPGVTPHLGWAAPQPGCGSDNGSYPKTSICAPKCPFVPRSAHLIPFPLGSLAIRIHAGKAMELDPCCQQFCLVFFFFPHPKSPERLWEPGGEMSQIPCAGGQGDLPGPSCSAPGAILTNLHLLKSGHIPKMGKSTKLLVHRAGPLSMGRLWW